METIDGIVINNPADQSSDPPGQRKLFLVPHIQQRLQIRKIGFPCQHASDQEIIAQPAMERIAAHSSNNEVVST